MIVIPPDDKLKVPTTPAEVEAQRALARKMVAEAYAALRKMEEAKPDGHQ